MIISDSKLRGIIAVCLMVVIIPLITLLSRFIFKYKIPVFADQCSNGLVIEIVENTKSSGVYFVPQGTSVNQLLKSAGIEGESNNNFQLKTGMKLIINSTLKNQDVVATEMTNAAKLAVGLPIDINQAKEEDLILIKGIGPATAKSIIALRKTLNGFQDINQLMQIKGIKEKKILEIKKYIYVENQRK